MQWKSMLMLLCLCSSLWAQTDRENENLQGKVKTVNTTVYRSTKKGDEIKLLSISQTATEHYNEPGYLTQYDYQINTMSLGTGPKRSIHYTLDENNQAVKTTYFKDSVPGLEIHQTYQNKKLINLKAYNDGQCTNTEHHTYDEKGNQISFALLDEKGDTTEKRLSAYNDKGKVTDIKIWQNGEYQGRSHYSYPDKSTTKVEQFDAAGVLSSFEINKYNNKEALLENLEYDAQGKLTKKSINEYDEWGNNTLRRTFNGEGEEELYNFMLYRYRYDEKGNWTQKIEFLHNGNTLDVVKRTFEYYE